MYCIDYPIIACVALACQAINQAHLRSQHAYMMSLHTLLVGQSRNQKGNKSAHDRKPMAKDNEGRSIER